MPEFRIDPTSKDRVQNQAPELTEQERALVTLREAYRVVFDEDAFGRRVWEDLQASGYLWRTTTVLDNTGAVDMAASIRNEGARAFVLAIRRHIEQAKAGYRPAQREAVASLTEGA